MSAERRITNDDNERPEMKDFYATIKIQHGPIREAMLELGIKSASELARRAGKHATGVGRLLNFKDSPRLYNGELTAVAKAVCEALHAEPAYLFPKHLDVELPCNTISAFADRAQLAGLTPRQLSPAEECEREDSENVLNKVLSTLTEREETVIRETLLNRQSVEAVAVRLGVTRARIHQIKQAALRKLCSPGRKRLLAEVYDNGDVF